ncbi:MAG: aspartate-semialdehyde dehydrogenase [Halarsenatibacteraceae bacterium]
MSYNIGVLGASGLVGQEIVKILEEREFPLKNIRLFASERSAGKTIEFKGKKVEIEKLTVEKAKESDILLSSMPSGISQEIIPEIADSDTIVIDNSSAFRQVEGIPLIVPEVNRGAIPDRPEIIANPNCSTIQLVLVLKPLADKYGLDEVVVSTYQSVSGSGQKALEALRDEAFEQLKSGSKQAKYYERPIAFNLLPAIDYFHADGFSNEEVKMLNESRKILGDPELHLNATCVRVPVYYGHAESCYLILNRDFKLDAIKDLLAAAPGVKLYDNPENAEYPEPVLAEETDETLVGRIRRDRVNTKALNLYIAANNIRKGAALNAVQIAEELV